MSNRKTTIQGFEHINNKDTIQLAYSNVFSVGGYQRSCEAYQAGNRMLGHLPEKYTCTRY